MRAPSQSLKRSHELEEFFQSMESNVLTTMKALDLTGVDTSPLPGRKSPENLITASPVFHYDRVVSLLLDSAAFSPPGDMPSIIRMSTFDPSVSITKEATGVKTRVLRHRTSSLPSLHSASLQKAFIPTQGDTIIDREKVQLRQHIWQDRVLHDNHFPVKFFGGHPRVGSEQSEQSSLVKRSRDSSSSGSVRSRSRRFSEDLNGYHNGNLMDELPITLISCVSAVLCYYLIDVTDPLLDPNKEVVPVPCYVSAPGSRVSPCRRSSSPSTPSIFNTADPRNYPAQFSFVPREITNVIFNISGELQQGDSSQVTSMLNCGNESFPNVIPKVTVLMLQEFIHFIFTQSQMEKECLIIALLYIERVLFSSPPPTFYLTSLNWRAFVMCALLVASKMWDDFSMVNEDYVAILLNLSKTERESGRTVSAASTLRPFAAPADHFDLSRVNILEAKFLALVRFHTCVTGEDYARVYFRITEIITLLKIKQARQKEQVCNREDACEGSPKKKLKKNDEPIMSDVNATTAPLAPSGDDRNNVTSSSPISSGHCHSSLPVFPFFSTRFPFQLSAFNKGPRPILNFKSGPESCPASSCDSNKIALEDNGLTILRETEIE